MERREPRLRSRHVVITVAAVAIAAVWLTHGSFSSAGPLEFVVGTALFLYLPGALTLELFKISRPRTIALTLAAGLPSGLASYSVLGALLPAHAYAVLMSFVFAVVIVRHPDWVRPTLMPRSASPMAAAIIITLLSFGLLSNTSFRSIERHADGRLGYTHSLDHENVKIGGSDAFFHAAVTSALARSSGQSSNPFVHGAPLAYHAGMDLVASAFDRELGIPPVDLAARLLPTLFVVTLSLLVFQLSRAVGLTGFYSLLAVLLTFASDARLLFYLVPLQPEWPSRYWLGYFTSYPATTYFWTNPHLPALVVFVAALVVLASDGKSLRGRILAGVLFGATALFKVFLALHVAVVLSLLLAYRFVTSAGRYRFDMVPVVATAGFLMLASAVGAGLYGQSEVVFAVTYLGPVLSAFRLSGLGPLAEVLEQARDEPGVWVALQALASFAVYVVILLGVRVIALVPSLKQAGKKPDEPVRWFLGAFFLLGLVPALFIAIRVSGLNNSFWFTNQSLFIGSVLVALTLSQIGRPVYRRLAVMLTLIVALIPTWRDVTFRGEQPQASWSAGELEAAVMLEQLSSTDAVVLHPVNRETPSPASHIAGRSTVLTYWQGYPFSFAPAEEVQKRASDIATFFQTDDPVEARDILARYGASWVYAPRSRALSAPVAAMLEEAFANTDVTLYRLRESR